MEKILRVEEATFKRKETDYSAFEGFQVITDQQTIKVGISSGQSCCENFGYLTTNDDLKYFEGAELVSVQVVDKALNVEKLKSECDEHEAMFVNFNTTKGVMQLVAYNSHNGYYGHDAVLISKELNHEVFL